MSDDGAHMGVGAERALGTIVGGKEQPQEDEQMTPEQMLDKIREQPLEAASYDGQATACARVILEAYERYPELQDHPTEAVYLREADGQMVWNTGAVVLVPDFHEVLNQLHRANDAEKKVLSGLTGFMWGWAVNAVRYSLGLPPKPNPAIVTIGGE